MADAETTDGAAAIDPVCGMSVTIATAKHQCDHAGATFYFCGPGCKTKFTAAPGHYLNPPPLPEMPAGTLYTCPTHPEIRNDGPGSCPKCGMALEPMAPSADEPENHELKDMTRRFWIALALSLPVIALDIDAHIPALHGLVPMSGWIQALFTTPIVLWAASPFFRLAWASVINRHLNMFSLIGLGTGTAYLYSLVAVARPDWFPTGFPSAHGGVDVYFEAAAVIVVLVLLGQVLELRARGETGGAIRALLRLAPGTAWRVRDLSDDQEIPLSEVAAGDLLRIRPGDRVPVDGEVVSGASAIDESMVTGESMPVAKTAGQSVIGGTMNGTGALVMRAQRVGAETVLSRIAAMVSEAQRSRAPIQRLADQVAGWFVPVVLLIAVLAFIAWAVFGPAPALSYALIAAVSVLMIACPCALGLATPMSIGVGLGEGARMGVLIRSAKALERMEAVDTLVVDKTGTLTEGRPKVTAIRRTADLTEAGILSLAASLERSSEHPLAAAVVAEARARGLTLADASAFQPVTGLGVTGRVAGRTVAVGGPGLMARLGIVTEAHEGILVAVNGVLAGAITVADPIKPTTAAALDALRAAGMRIVMLSGDNQAAADAVGRALGIDTVHGGVLPEDKQRIVRSLRAEGRVVAMAGDGVNDAPALAAADVGIAMGAGTEVAIASAGITLVKGDLMGIVRARTLSVATMRNIRQNLAFAFAYNALGIPIAAGALYPVFGVLLSPIVAAAAMSLSSVSVIGNALRLRRLRL